MSDQPLDRDRITKLVSTILADDLHAKRVASLAGAAVGVLEGAALGIHAIGKALAMADVKVDVQVDGAPEALDRDDASGPRIGHSPAPGLTALPGEDGAGEEVEQTRSQSRMTGREESHSPGDGEDPLPYRDLREHVADEVLGGVLHASCVAGGADVGLAGEGNQALETAVGTAYPCEAPGEDATVQVGAKFPFDEGGEAVTVGAPFPGQGEERLQPLPDDLVQEGLLGFAMVE